MNEEKGVRRKQEKNQKYMVNQQMTDKKKGLWTEYLEKWWDAVGIAFVCVVKGPQGCKFSYTEKPQEIKKYV